MRSDLNTPSLHQFSWVHLLRCMDGLFVHPKGIASVNHTDRIVKGTCMKLFLYVFTKRAFYKRRGRDKLIFFVQIKGLPVMRILQETGLVCIQNGTLHKLEIPCVERRPEAQSHSQFPRSFSLEALEITILKNPIISSSDGDGPELSFCFDPSKSRNGIKFRWFL